MKQYSLVIVDGNEEWCGQLERTIEQHPAFRLFPSLHDGEAAMEFICQFRPDVIILDLIIPHYDGLYILNQVREMHDNYRPFIYILTALSIEKTIDRIASLDVDYYSTKPIMPDVVVDNLNKLLQEGSMTEEQAFQEDLETMLIGLGAPMHLLSTRCTREALRICYENEQYLYNVTGLYRTLAAQMDTHATYFSVERNIRTTVNKIAQGQTELFTQHFNDTKKLTNADFLYRAVHLLRKYALERMRKQRERKTVAAAKEGSV